MLEPFFDTTCFNSVTTEMNKLSVDYNEPIILFDGLCNYCHFMVDLAIRFDPDKKIKFAPLQTETAKQLKAIHGIGDHIDSMILVEDNQAYYYSTAVLRAAKHLNAPLSWLPVFLHLPVSVRDPLYRWIAKNRYRWFGRKDSCPIPTENIASRFLS